MPTTADRDLAQAIDLALEDLLRHDPVRASHAGHAAHDGAYADLSEGGRRVRTPCLIRFFTLTSSSTIFWYTCPSSLNFP